MPGRKWVEINATGYLGLVMAMVGILGPYLLEIQNPLIRLLGVVAFIVGIYLVIKDRKEHGL